MTEYSNKSIQEKLGITPETRLYIINPPVNFLNSITVRRVNHPDALDVLLLFTSSKEELTQAFPTLMSSIDTAGVFWVCWPKNTSEVESSLDDNRIREIGLLNGMVDVKVITIDDAWSALKFVFRLKDR